MHRDGEGVHLLKQTIERRVVLHLRREDLNMPVVLPGEEVACHYEAVATIVARPTHDKTALPLASRKGMLEALSTCEACKLHCLLELHAVPTLTSAAHQLPVQLCCLRPS